MTCFLQVKKSEYGIVRLGVQAGYGKPLPSRPISETLLSRTHIMTNLPPKKKYQEENKSPLGAH